ncbi:hypothetical protein [Phascolarctobacterium faecium]|mgnify:CR=1 FL=1|uniref:hypothetical protein n=1 Tax=Phascolarctobacterium faecium TaxID=33025 RepID=UPI003FEF323C
MKWETFEEAGERDKFGHLGGLVMKCPICGKEFGCNKAYHVYTALVRRRRQYYCSYSCYKQRPNSKEKR